MFGDPVIASFIVVIVGPFVVAGLAVFFSYQMRKVWAAKGKKK